MKMFRHIWTVMQKELIQITRNNVMMMIALGGGILLTILFGYIYVQEKVTDLPIVVFDRDQTEMSRTIIRSFGDSERFKIVDSVNSFAAVEKAIQTEKAVLAFIIPPHLQQDIKEGHATEVGVISNGTNILVMNTAATAANTVVATISAKITMQVMQGGGMTPQKAYQAVTALSFRNRVWYNPTISYLVFMLLGLLGAVLQQVTLLGVAMSFSKEREDGTWEQLRVSGLSWNEFLCGKLLFYFVVFFMNAVVMYLLAFGWFGLPLRGDAFLVLALTVLFVVVMIALGMAISIVTPTIAQAVEFSMMLAMPSFLVSGYTWPYLSMPPAVQALSSLLPLTHFLEAFKSIVLLGNGWDVVAGKFGILALFALVCLPLAIILLKRRMVLDK